MLALAIVQELEQALRGLQYGTVQLVIHDAHVVRIERVERVRLTVATEAASTTAPGRPTLTPEVRHAQREP